MLDTAYKLGRLKEALISSSQAHLSDWEIEALDDAIKQLENQDRRPDKRRALKVHVVVAEYAGVVSDVQGYLNRKDACQLRTNLVTQPGFNADEDIVTLWEITLPILS